MEVRGQLHAPLLYPQEEVPGTHWIGGDQRGTLFIIIIIIIIIIMTMTLFMKQGHTLYHS